MVTTLKFRLGNKVGSHVTSKGHYSHDGNSTFTIKGNLVLGKIKGRFDLQVQATNIYS